MTTEHNQPIEQLRLENKLLRDAINNLPVMFYILSPDGHFLQWNKALEEVSQYTPDELVELPILDVFDDAYKALAITEVSNVFLSHQSSTMEVVLVSKNGNKIPRLLSGSYMEIEGQPALVGVGIDIAERKNLENRIQELLTKRESQVILSAKIAQELLTTKDLTDLYRIVVNLIQEQFEYYHLQILRYDSSLKTAHLLAGYGEVGQKMLELEYSTPVEAGLIGRAITTGQPQLSSNVRQDPSWHPTPYLPNTQSELALPIRAGSRILGVLDVQSDEVDGLDENDVVLLEGLCGQIAIAVESIELRREMEERIQELNTLQRFMTRDGWEEYRQTNRLTIPGYRFGQNELQTISQEIWSQKKQTPNESEKQTVLPLEVRGSTIGQIGLEVTPDNPLSPDDEAFLAAISEQVAQALESARLLEQTQTALVTQERLSGELKTVAEVSAVTSTIMERDSLLQTVVDLTKSSFNLYHTHIYLLSDDGSTLLLRAGADEVGRLMALEERFIMIHEGSIVARCARNREAVMVNNTRQSPDFLPHPLLPNTRSELATPMVVGDTLIGVLDVQSDVVDRFTEQDVLIMKTLSSQIAVAVQNAEQFAEQLNIADKLREVEKLKSEFLASMSHELRTPLNSIIGFADVLLEGLDGDLNERMDQDVRLIRDSGDHLRNLIGDILDMSKIEAGKMELRYDDLDMRQMAQDIIATANPLAKAKSLALYLNLSDDVSYIRADATRLRQVMWNIMGNAIKFTEKGSVTLGMELKDDFLLISIRDTGIGIAPENISIVFEQFRQVDGALNRKAEGTGLGMPISKKLVELHGGDIWIESTVGMGTTFWFTIPVRPPQKDPVFNF